MVSVLWILYQISQMELHLKIALLDSENFFFFQIVYFDERKNQGEEGKQKRRRKNEIGVVFR